MTAPARADAKRGRDKRKRKEAEDESEDPGVRRPGHRGRGALLLRRRTAARLAGNVVASNGRANGRDGQQDRWHAVTVNRPPEEVSSEGRLPDPLAELGDRIEVQIRPAPGDRGTEIHARVRGTVSSGLSKVQARMSGEDPRGTLRRALRETQWLLETGEVLKPDTPPSTKPTPGGKLIGLATSRSWKEGRL